MEAFYKALYKAKSDMADYSIKSKEWDEKFGDKPNSIRDKLEFHKQEIREQASERPYRQSKDRGAR